MKNKVVYAWLESGSVFYIGIGREERSQYMYNRNPHCRRTRERAERQGTFEIKILYQDLSWEEACEIECQLIQQYGRRDLGTGQLTNMTNGGDGSPGVIQSKETIEKRRKSYSGESTFWYGKSHSEKTRHKMREAKLGKKNPAICKPVMTPLGEFESCSTAAHVHGIRVGTMSYRLLSKSKNMSQYYYINHD